MAQSLLGVLTQILVKIPEGRGRKAVIESMVMTRAIGKLIMEDKIHMIPSQIQTGKDRGMQLMDQALLEAIKAKEIDPDDAYRYAKEQKKFQRYITDSTLLPELGE